MHKEIFVNLAVTDLPKSKAFYEALGMSINPQFTNEQAACIVVGPNIYAMLLVKPFFQSFIDKTIADSKTTTETLLALSCENRAEVDAIVVKAAAAGGAAHRQPQDHGFMYSHGFEDPDGHIWEVMYMDMAAAPKQM